MPVSSVLRLILIGLAGCCLLGPPATRASQYSPPLLLAQNEPTPGTASTAPPWPFPASSATEFDWIQLTSGEWLKGEFNFLYKKTVEFDSDELDLQQLDWEDVKAFYGRGLKSVRLLGPITVVGALVVTEDTIFVTANGQTREFDREDVISITQGDPEEIRNWAVKLGIGLTLTGGNTEQLDYTASLNVKRLTTATRYLLDYLGNFTRTDAEETRNNQRLSTSFDVFQSKSLFWRPIFAEYFRDPFQNTDYRITVGAGVGYTLIDTADTDWVATAGPAYQTTRFVSVEPGQDDTASTPALVVSTKYETALSKAVDFTGVYRFNLVNEASGTYSHHAIATFETEVTRLLDFDVSFVWDRVQDPTPTATGAVPKQNDFQMIFALGFDF